MYRGKVDIVLASSVVLLIMLGQLMVFSASSMYANLVYGSLTYFFQKQLLWGALAILLIILMSKFDYKKLQTDQVSMVMIISTLILLAGVLIFGRTIKGASRWYSLGFMSFQPSEIAKISIIIFLAHKLSRKGIENLNFKEFLLPIYGFIGAIVMLIFVQPDLSSSLMIAAISVSMLFVSRVRQKYLLLTSLSLIPAAMFFLGWKSYQLRRIKDWLTSIFDPMLAAHQVKQSVIGIGRGGIFGNGMGESKQKLFFLPDSHTDFIFSIIGEEFGFIGTSLILILFVIILVRGLRIARKAPDGFGQFLALGITLNVILYAFVNVAVVTNLLPATGLPMPFISYGGSHLMFLGISVGLLLNISRSVRHGNSETGWSEYNAQRNTTSILEVD